MKQKEMRAIRRFVKSPLHSVFWDVGHGHEEIIRIINRGSRILGFFNSCDGEHVELPNVNVEDIKIYKNVDWRKDL